MTRRDPIIMILDGDSESHETVRSILEEAGIVSEGGSAVARDLQSIDPAVGVVLLDLGFLEGNEADLISRLVDQRPGIRIIALADESEVDRVLDALRDGACDYLAKPLHAEELTLSVRRAMEHQALWAQGAHLKQRLSLLGARVEALVARAGGQRGENRLALVRDSIVTAAAEVLNAEKASLLLLDRDDDVLRVVAWSGRALKPEEAEPLDVGDGVAGRIFESSEAWLVEDASTDPRVTSVDREGRYRSGSFVAAP
ncbi:MAG: response regulator, partial [Myxococcota bacterium]|nr:response regulator [Myxococcota bacterium]